MSELFLYGLPGVVIGFIVGALVFRKHAHDGEALVQKGKEVLANVEAKVNAKISELKK